MAVALLGVVHGGRPLDARSPSPFQTVLRLLAFQRELGRLASQRTIDEPDA